MCSNEGSDERNIIGLRALLFIMHATMKRVCIYFFFLHFFSISFQLAPGDIFRIPTVPVKICVTRRTFLSSDKQCNLVINKFENIVTACVYKFVLFTSKFLCDEANFLLNFCFNTKHVMKRERNPNLKNVILIFMEIHLHEKNFGILYCPFVCLPVYLSACFSVCLHMHVQRKTR